MKKSPNQIRVELKELAQAHLQINSFYWGDVQDATSKAVVYPLMDSYYPSATLNSNTSDLQIVIEVSDRLYKDESNLNDVESDTMQIIRDLYNVINKSTRWKKIGKVQSATVAKFKFATADVVAGHRLTINIALRDVSGICDLPIQDYDYDQDVPAGACPQATVINTDLSYSQLVDAGSVLELQDILYSITNSEATVILSGSEVAQSDVIKVLPDINFTDSDGTTTQQPSGKDLVCTPAPVQTSGIKPLKTGWITPTFSNDDGVLQRGREDDFLTLSINNPFGNTNRFTDELGTQVYANDIVIDWSTYENDEVLGYYRIPENGLPTSIFTSQPYTKGGFSGWYVSNIKETENVQYYASAAQRLDYAPFNISSKFLFTSTGLNSNYVWEVWTFGNSLGNRIFVGTSGRDTLLSRYFTVTGTTLT